MAASITPLRAPAQARWASLLQRASDEKLVALLRARPDLAEPQPASLAELAKAVISPASCAAALDRIDRSARQAIEACCVLSEPIAPERLAELLGCRLDELDGATGRLRASFLLLAGAEGLAVNPGVRSALRHPARLGRSYGELAAQSPVKELTEVARRLGVGFGANKTGILASITAGLAERGTVQAALEGAPPGTLDLARRFALRGPVVELGYSYASLERLGTDRTPTGWLLRRGILVAVSWGVAEMPLEAAITLRGGVIWPDFSPLPPALATEAADPGHVEQAAAEAALSLVASVTAIVAELGALAAKVLRDGGLGVRELRRLARACGRDETATARLCELAGVAGLVGIDPLEHVALPTEQFDDYLGLSAAQRWRVLAAAWLSSPIELSLAGSDDVDGKPVPPLLVRVVDPGSAERRSSLAGVLTSIAPASAATRASVADLADWRAPARSVASRASHVVGWQLDEAALLGVVAAPPSSGGAHPSPGEPDPGPKAIRAAGEGQGLVAPSLFGRLLLEGEQAAAAAALAALAPPVVEEIVVQADLTAVAAGELAATLRRDLELAADIESASAATVFRFGEVSLRRWFDAGRSSAELLALLERHAPRGVPQSLTYLVEDLGRRHGRIRAGAAASYVRAEDAALVAELAGSKRLARCHLRALAPTVLVSPLDPDELVEQLRQAGYLAAGEDADGSLSVRRPPARRLATGGARGRPRLQQPGVDAEGARELVAALRAPRAPATGGAISRRSLAPGRDAGGLEGLVAGPVAPGGGLALSSGDGPAGLPLPGAGPEPGEGGTGWPESELVERAPGRARSGRLARPGQIAKGLAALRSLVDVAMSYDWAIRLAVRDPQAPGGTREQYARPFSLRRDVLAMHLPDGEVDSVPLGQIVWARILTEAEEEAHDLVGDLL